jgi:hypothetical protein
MAVSSILGNSGASSQKYNPFAPQKSGGNSFADVLKSAAGAAAAPTGKAATDGLSEMHKQADKSLSDFSSALDGLLKTAGVDTTQKIRLQTDSQGGVKVEAGQADREKIEKVFAEHPELAAQLQSVASEFRRLHDAEQTAQGAQPNPNSIFGVVLEKGVTKVEFN